MNVAPGWYDDPHQPGLERFHDGRSWTSHVRNDLPDIPVAPWVDPRSVVRPVDSRPPQSTRAAASAVGIGLLGIGLVTWAGASSTLQALADSATEPVVAPERTGREPVLPLYSCEDVAGVTLDLVRQNEDLPITRWTAPAVTVADHQPIVELPPEGEQYIVLVCTGEASFADGRVGDVGMVLSVDSGADLWADYAEQ
ncbi:MAG: DUF2510 domain-containing protein [Actinomycetota bacterium]